MYALTDTIDMAGDWWDSANPEETSSGQLTFSRRGGIQLFVNRAFNPLSGDVRPGDPNPRYECIHGRTVKGEAVTLIDAQQLGASLSFGSAGLAQPGRIHARILAIGAHLPPNFRFPSMTFRIPGLQIWLGKQVIMQRMTFDSENRIARTDYSIVGMDREDLDTPAISSKISVRYEYGLSLDAYSSVQAKVSTWITITPDHPQLSDWFFDQSRKLEILFSFLSGDVFVSDAIHSQVDKSRHRVSVLFAGNTIESLSKKHPEDFFLSRPSISASLSECCNKWLEVFPRIDTPASLAMSVMASKKLWLHIRFLSLFQALEGFHRALYDGKYMEEAAYDAVIGHIQGAIPNAVSSSHRAALESRIKYGNEYSLRKRIGELEQLLTDEIRLRLFGVCKSVPMSWINTRNYYTHWDEKLKENILDDQEMYYANIRIAHFLNTLFRLLAGVPASDIEAAFGGTSEAAQDLIEINIIERRATDPTFIPHAIMTISSGDDTDIDRSPFTDDGGQSDS